MSKPGSGTPVLFVHGFWHGSWCWAEVLARVTGAGVRGLAVDMAGHGLRARHPECITRRPFDPALLATEPSPVADVDLDQVAELLISQIEQFGAGDPVIVVAHSMGGAALTRAAQLAPSLVSHAVYLTAVMPETGVMPLTYMMLPENSGSLGLPVLVADPSVVGAARIDVGSADPEYRELLRQTFYGDVPDAAAEAAMSLLTPDAPNAMILATTTVTADGWGSIPRSYVVCTQDRALLPALQRRFIAEADAAFPDNPTTVHTLEASHSPFLSMPEQVADIVLKLAA